jgi:hypothetical protein
VGQIEILIFIFSLMFTIIGFLVVWIMNNIRADMHDSKNAIVDATESIQELNIKVAIIISTTEQHDGRIKRIENHLQARSLTSV